MKNVMVMENNMQQRATIIKTPHLLYVGSNGKATHGITLRSDLPLEVCRAEGYQHEYELNVNTVKIPGFHTYVGITVEEQAELVKELEALDNNWVMIRY